MKFTEIHKMTVSELDTKLNELRDRKNELEVKMISGEGKNLKEKFQVRKDIARVLTAKTMKVKDTTNK